MPNAYASKICAGKIKDPSGVKRKDFRGSKAEGGLMEATSRLKRQGLKEGKSVKDVRKESANKIFLSYFRNSYPTILRRIFCVAQKILFCKI